MDNRYIAQSIAVCIYKWMCAENVFLRELGAQVTGKGDAVRAEPPTSALRFALLIR